jgi:hypothetical protein
MTPLEQDDGTQTSHSLQQWLGALTFADLTADQVTTRLVDEVTRWAETQGWRVYRRAPSVFPLPPPLRGNSVVDVACARPDAQPIVVEVDRLERRRTVDKLLAEAAAGRLAILVRWGSGPFTPPPLPVHLVIREAVRQRGHWHTVVELPPPEHSGAVEHSGTLAAEPEELPWEEK